MENIPFRVKMETKFEKSNSVSAAEKQTLIENCK